VKEKKPFQPWFEKKSKTMKRIIITNGIIAGVIVSAMLLISIPLQQNGVLDPSNGMVIGYASMVIALSTIFFGIKTYRDQHANGTISFWQATKIGLAIAAIAAILYAGVWEVYYSFKGQQYIDFYMSHYVEDLKADGLSEPEIEKERIEMDQNFEAYKSIYVRIPVTLMEILPVGIIVTLISAALLKRRQFLPA
jgi:hypothetical protein